MNLKAKKALIIAGLAVDVIITILLFVLSILILANMPDPYDVKAGNVDYNSFLGWFQQEPFRILLIIVLPLALLLVGNISLTIWYIKKTGQKEEKKSVSLNDLSDEEKAALKQKILQEMMQESNDSK